MAGLRKAQKAMTRRLLLSAALDLFNTKGYAATTIDEIAAAAGTTRVTFYAYFPSRADLMKALIGQLNELLGRTESPTHGSTARALVDIAIVVFESLRLDARLDTLADPQTLPALTALFETDIAGGQDHIGVGAWQAADGIRFHFPCTIVAWQV